MRVLQVEDDAATAMSVELMLKSEGINVYTTELGEEGVDLAKTYDYDIVLLDLGLPDMSGHEVLRQIRVAGVRTPVMIVSGRSEIESKVRCFSGGADDYLAKPFHKDELVARVQAIVRRSKGHAQAVVRAGEIAVNLDAKTVEVAGKRVHLTGKEYQMLELLALRLDTTLTKEMFLNHLYGGLDEPETKIIDVFICKLRAKLREHGVAGHLQTIWGRGYKLTAQAAEDRLQKAGTVDSIVGRVLVALKDRRPRRAAGLAGDLKVSIQSVRGALTYCREQSWCSRDGRAQLAIWSITDAGLEEHRKRAALSAVA